MLVARRLYSLLHHRSSRSCRSILTGSRMKRNTRASSRDANTDTKQQPNRRRRRELPQQSTQQPTAASAKEDDGLRRCGWATTYKGAASAEYIKYHDEEWGRPEHDDNKLFELIVLEGAQAGLSWSTILAKREAYRAAFDNFDPAKVAEYDDSRLQQLMAQDSGTTVVRHKGKLQSAVNNAKVCLQLQRDHGSLDSFVWSFVPDGQPIINSWTSMIQIPTKTPESEALSGALKKAGMTFVGPTIMYAFMQAAGLVNDHLVDCHCRQGLATQQPADDE